MELKYEISKEDYINFNKNYIATTKALRANLNRQRFGKPLVYMIFAVLLSMSTKVPRIYWLGGFGAISVVWILAYPRFVNKKIENDADKLLKKEENKRILGKRALKISTTGISEYVDSNETKVVWNEVQRINADNNYIYIYVGQNSAFTIPLNGIEVTKENIIEELKKYVDEQKFSII
ncbi:YcxB-like protein [Clostridium cavendishii DSM 21758]|uniref:YcxB-like protein n=1 Tax=Clostridium cavendishii DSM 21758 TaxID=1121302 RepID=A0A1M6CUP6_9CLOT|nr:YcxB family protein [Clostridium cavendishii]SHI64603.1 YcxB-like protein [Clostridium cavendishii DSM 21758]